MRGWIASGIPVTFVDAQFAFCEKYPCTNCTHIDMFKAHFGVHEDMKELEFISIDQYVARVGKATAYRHTQRTEGFWGW
jgi:hypothetical protein